MIKILGSLSFAIFLIAALAVILIISTTLESWYGTPFAQKIFYQAGWFDFFLALLAINIVCSTLTRVPFKKYHTGFIVTHIGILMLLVGSLLSRLWGAEGQMLLYENESTNSIRQQTYELRVHTADHETYGFDLKSSPNPLSRKLAVPGTDIECAIEEVWENAVVKDEIKKGSLGDPLNHALRVTIESQSVGFNSSLWLVENNPADPHAAKMQMGMATVELLKEKPKKAARAEKTEAPVLRIEQLKTGEVFRLDPVGSAGKEVPLGKSGLKVVGIEYFPDARVEQNKLVSVSEKSLNPAVQFEVIDAAGQKERHTKFALFPEFESLHGKNTQNLFNLQVDFLVPELVLAEQESKRPSLVFYPAEGGLWAYQTTSSKTSSEGLVEIGKTTATGWMDFSFRVDEILDNAVIEKKVTKSEPHEKGDLAVRVAVYRAGKPVANPWLLLDNPVSLDGPEGHLVLSVEPKTLPVPFQLLLKDFRKVDYPGTQNPSSFESDVVLEDAAEKKMIHQTISMNRPMDYKGYRIFQSSYIQNTDLGEASVFTVAKNPGITLIYSGACVLFLGVVLVFYVKPLSSIHHHRKQG